MILTKELIAKGLVGTTLVVAPTTLGIVYRKEIGQALSSSEVQSAATDNNDAAINALLESAGLSCDDTNGCSLKSGKTLNVKHGDTKEEGKSFTITSPQKIKLYKNTNDYNEKAKFVIEGGNITLTTTGTGTTITQLEEFETYEIVSEADKHYLSRKSTAIDEKRKLLGLNDIDGCTLPTDTTTTTTTCSGIDSDKLKKINFDGKGENGATIENGETVTLTITKVESSDSIFGTGGYKFSFQPNKDITISSGTTPIYIKKGTNTEFKIKKEGTSLSLEKAWNITNLAGKVNLKDCNTSEKKCSLGETINVFNDNTNYVTDSQIQEGSKDKKIKYEEDQENYFQGIKFTVDGEEDITLSNGTKQGTIEKIEAPGSSNVSYEIKEQTVGSNNKWFLSKKST